MFGQNNVNGRQVGVGLPEGQGRADGRAAPKTVFAFQEAKTYAVQWTDVDGTVHQELVHEINGLWYRAPNGENYAKQLRVCSDWLSKAFAERAADSKTATVPTQDAVDIAAGG
jgi:hypothetical protein